MRLKFGSTWLGDANATRYTWSRQLLRSAGGVGYGMLWTCQVEESLFRVADQYDATVKMAIIEDALATQNQTLVFFHDDGSSTQNQGNSPSSVSGVRCTSGPTWLPTLGGWVTHKSFACAFEWETALPGSAGILLDFKETLTLSGGTPLVAILQPIDGTPAVIQEVASVTPYRASQSGSAVGYASRPNPLVASPPIFFTSPGVPLRPVLDSTSQFSAQRVGQGSKGFGVAWQREFVAVYPLGGVPQEWVG